MDQSLIRSEPVVATLIATPSADAAPSTASEALHELTEHAARRRADALAPVLAARALQVTRGAEFAVARDALDALLRRLGSSRDAELIVKSSPHGMRVARRGRSKRSPRVYDVWFDDAGEASCSCPDFAKAALGLCKHVLAAMAQPRRHHSAPRAVRWDPVRPLTGPGDWLARLWHDPRVTLPRSLAAMFQATPAGRPIDPAWIDDARRAATVELLLAAARRDPDLAEPAVVPQLEREHAAIGRRWSLRARELDRLLRGMKQRLFPYQRDGVERFLRVGRLLLADDMGLGKTAQAIASCHALFAAGKARRAVIVTPAALKPQWAREWRAFTDLALITVDGQPDERARIYRRRGDGVLLVNYEQLLRDLALVRAYDPDLVVLDEAQRIKNWETKTAAVVKQLEPAWRLVLTGTPMENRVEELASIMEWVDEYAIEPRWRLPSWHTVRVDGSREVIGARNLDTLRQRLAPHMLRRVRGDVLAQLPPRRDHRISVALTDAQVAAHAELDLPIARVVAQARHRPLTQPEFLRLMALLNQQRMICNGMALRDFVEVWPTLERSGRRSDRLLARLDSPKLVEFRDRITDLVVTQQRKVVVFSQWRRMLRLAAWVTADVLARAGLRVAFFTGEETQRRRTENLVAFHDDPATRVLFATDAGGVGLNLQRAASCCINLDLPWNPAVLEQRVGRIFRMGQSQPVDVYNLITAGGIEDRIAGLVGDKRALFVGLFDGTSDDVAFDSAGSFMTRVHEIIRPELPPDAEIDAADDAADDAVDRPDDSLDPDEVEAPPALAAAATEATTASATLDLGDLGSWLSGVQVRPLDDGRVALELPRSAATALGGLLRALATAVEGPPSTPP
ncbi:MAG TPA: DEAD/DEAH box helicase [Kofleriaceae bacterium]|nr:DEAD/DEAH box helicase [Kofleriaceae bacterium]